MFSSRSSSPEPPPVGSHDRRFRGLFAGVPQIAVLVLIAVTLLLIFLNSRFTAAVAACRIYYPGATVVAEDQPYFLQPFGSLYSELMTPDDPETVTEWYNANYGATMRAAVEEGDFSSITHLTWEVTPADGGGSRIVLVCP